jgi:hypothetical protein
VRSGWCAPDTKAWTLKLLSRRPVYLYGESLMKYTGWKYTLCDNFRRSDVAGTTRSIGRTKPL